MYFFFFFFLQDYNLSLLLDLCIYFSNKLAGILSRNCCLELSGYRSIDAKELHGRIACNEGAFISEKCETRFSSKYVGRTSSVACLLYHLKLFSPENFVNSVVFYLVILVFLLKYFHHFVEKFSK